MLQNPQISPKKAIFFLVAQSFKFSLAGATNFLLFSCYNMLRSETILIKDSGNLRSVVSEILYSPFPFCFNPLYFPYSSFKNSPFRIKSPLLPGISDNLKKLRPPFI